MDIRAALESTSLAQVGERCCVGRWLDGIDDDTPGKAELVATFSDAEKGSRHYRRLTDLTFLARSLGYRVSTKSVQLHRAGDCGCRGRSA